jgi:hypothetical protein
MTDWYAPAELAGMPGLPSSRRRVAELATRERWEKRKRRGRGGGWEYDARCLPAETRAHLTLLEAVQMTAVQERTPGQEAPGATDGAATEGQHRSPDAPTGSDIREAARAERWARFERLPQTHKDMAMHRARLLDEAVAAGAPAPVPGRTLRRWLAAVRGIPRADWPPLLAPGYVGRTATAECSPEAWDCFKADVLRPEAPRLTACYERLKRAAAERGWQVPSLITLKRRLVREVPRAARVLAREGAEALDRLYPAQRRDRSALSALEVVNADGHKFDVFVRWPDGTVSRPVGVFWQCIYSGMMLSHRVDQTECAELVRLSCGDLVERYGIPRAAYLDNGRGFASKWITGRMTWRHRFKVKDEEPAGVLTQLGVEVHWVTPYRGQAKPIERAFLDFCNHIATHPAFAGAYTGNKPTAKPANYASKAVPLERFLEVLESEVHAHNARAGRRAAVCRGRSFAQTFAESYSRAVVRKATPEQRRLWLLAAEGVRGDRVTGEVTLLGNRYWTEALVEHAGQRLTVRFDPQRLLDPIHVYRLDGRYVCTAECKAATGFEDVDAARSHAKAKGDWKRAQKAALAAERRLGIDQVAELVPLVAAPALPDASVVQVDFARGQRAEPGPAAPPSAPGQPEEDDAEFRNAVGLMERAFWKD